MRLLRLRGLPGGVLLLRGIAVLPVPRIAAVTVLITVLISVRIAVLIAGGRIIALLRVRIGIGRVPIAVRRVPVGLRVPHHGFGVGHRKGLSRLALFLFPLFFCGYFDVLPLGGAFGLLPAEDRRLQGRAPEEHEERKRRKQRKEHICPRRRKERTERIDDKAEERAARRRGRELPCRRIAARKVSAEAFAEEAGARRKLRDEKSRAKERREFERPFCGDETAPRDHAHGPVEDEKEQRIHKITERPQKERRDAHADLTEDKAPDRRNDEQDDAENEKRHAERFPRDDAPAALLVVCSAPVAVQI